MTEPGDPRRRPGRPAARRRLVARRASSTRSTRAASPTATATASGDLPGIIDHLDHLAPRPSASTRSGSRRSTRRRGSTSATTSATTPRSTRSSGPMPTSTGSSPRPTAAGIRVILDLVMNHTSDQHRVVRGQPPVARRPVRRLVPVARPGRASTPTGKPLPPNNWVSFFGGPGWAWEPRRGQFYLHTFLAEQPDLNWREPGRRGRPVGDGPGLARPRRRRLPARRLQRVPQAPRPAVEPGAAGGSTAWTRQDHVYDRDQPDFPELLAAVPGDRRRASRAG